MKDGFYSLSSKALPNDIALEIHHGYDFEVPFSQANYNFLDYKFEHKNGDSALARIYFDELSMPSELRSEIEITPDFEPYSRDELPDAFVSSILLTMTALGLPAVYNDFEGESVSLANLYDEDTRKKRLSQWISIMHETEAKKK